MDLFMGEYAFRGKHAIYVKRLTAGYGEQKISIFQKNVDVYALAAVVGMVYKRQSAIDQKGTETAKIATDAFQNNLSMLLYNYRMIMLLHDKETLNMEERIARAFRYDNKEALRKTGDDIFNGYVLGGVEVLYEKIFSGINFERVVKLEDCLQNLYGFMQDFHMRYGTEIDREILDLCRLVKAE
jgi:hypothetical protein